MNNGIKGPEEFRTKLREMKNDKNLNSTLYNYSRSSNEGHPHLMPEMNKKVF